MGEWVVLRHSESRLMVRLAIETQYPPELVFKLGLGLGLRVVAGLRAIVLFYYLYLGTINFLKQVKACMP